MDKAALDLPIRLAAVQHLERASAGDVLTSDDLKAGFVFQGIARGDELVDYAFMGHDPAAADNRWLREARDAPRANGPDAGLCSKGPGSP
jgi:putative restriction endonuclease